MSLFDNIKNEDLEIKYIDYLKSLGYIIISPKEIDSGNVKNATDLVDYFYSLLQYYNQDRKLHYSKASTVDRKKANSFIKTRIEAGAGNKKRAVKECAAIVRCVIENEPEFAFSEPLHSFDCFGQDSMKWVTDKAISIINNENTHIIDKELNMFMDRIAEKQEVESLDSFYNNIGELKRILGGLKDAKE